MRVAIIGCSFSHLEFAQENWAYKLPKLYPSLDFYNYSMGGMGSLYQDMCLKHALYVDFFDYIIVQCTYGLRWHVPETVEFVKGEIDVIPSLAFTKQQVEANLYHMVLTEKVTKLVTLAKAGPQKDTQFLKKPIRTSYHWLFVKQLEALSKHHAISYFSFPDLEFTKNNIGQKYDVWSWFDNNYSAIDIDNMMDDTNHLNEHGNDVLLHEYILKSKVKENLTYLC